MPPIEEEGRNQDAVLWAAAGLDSYGKPTVIPPVDLAVKWNDKQQEVQDPKGRLIRCDATVIVAQDVTLNSIMRLGTVDALPDAPDNLYQVVSRETVPDVNNRSTFKQVMLSRFGDTLPEVIGT